jgi:cell wall-associated NlpC family hydrolase
MNVRTVCAFLVTAAVLAACASSSKIETTGDPRIDDVLHTAGSLLGTSYCASGTTPDCFDCSGFVSYCFGHSSLLLPRSSREMYAWQGGKDVARTMLQPGDLVFFNTGGERVSHVGIVVGNERFIHASTSSGVIITSLNDPYWKSRYVGARRVLRP